MMLLTRISVGCRHKGWVLVPNCVSPLSDIYLIDGYPRIEVDIGF